MGMPPMLGMGGGDLGYAPLGPGGGADCVRVDKGKGKGKGKGRRPRRAGREREDARAAARNAGDVHFIPTGTTPGAEPQLQSTQAGKSPVAYPTIERILFHMCSL